MAKEMVVVQSIVINKPSSVVFDFLKYARNQEQFSVWNMKDPNKETQTNGTDGTVGFTYSWNSKDKSVGVGSQTISKIFEGQTIEYKLNFEKPMKNTGDSKFVVEAITETQTSVTWDFRGPTKFPMSLFSGLISKMLGKDIAQSLTNLKNKLEQ
jgi:uncharacterized membrane protein